MRLKGLFRGYDLRLAESLGIALADSESDYDIGTILARDFGDDGAWTARSIVF